MGSNFSRANVDCGNFLKGTNEHTQNSSVLFHFKLNNGHLDRYRVVEDVTVYVRDLPTMLRAWKR
jgi:hypothetical protein